ncbi:MAG: CsgG/HfaB family protein [Acidobacteriota bacterium]|nr:CsgG/HfaB family protein [Acidobacteriota bacterium]
MNRTAILTLAFAVLLAGLGLGTASAELRYTVSVSKFDNEAGYIYSWSLGDAWGTVMTDLLNQTGRFIVLGETDMRNEALAEQDMVASGRTAQGGKIAVTGQMTPAQLLVKGAITHVQHETGGGRGGIRVKGIRLGGKKEKAEVNATVYIVDSTTGQVLSSKSVVGSSNRKGGTLGYSGSNWGGDVGGFKNDNLGKAIEAAVSEAVDWIVAELPGIAWTGTVAMTKDGKVYVNRGTREGVASGQTFVVGSVDVIRDPDTGEVLDESMNEVARLRVDSVKEKLSICSVVSGNSSAVERGMAVHLP